MNAKSKDHDLAGPFDIEAAERRDAEIPEKNDWLPPSEAEWLKTAAANKNAIIRWQQDLIAALRERGRLNKETGAKQSA
jgi:hypothetical protein